MLRIHWIKEKVEASPRPCDEQNEYKEIATSCRIGTMKWM